MEERIARAFAEMDAANADDPNRILVRGRCAPKEQAQAELACEWVKQLCEAPSEALQLAARAHHLRRFALPRAAHPAGRAGYLAWRRELQHFHADEAGRILERCGFEPALIEKVQRLIRKEPGGGAEAQVFEDALCLVFLETQLEALAERLEPARGASVLRQTFAKMSPRARALAAELPLGPRGSALVQRVIKKVKTDLTGEIKP